MLSLGETAACQAMVRQAAQKGLVNIGLVSHLYVEQMPRSVCDCWVAAIIARQNHDPSGIHIANCAYR
ncbi:MAG: hypothetical protein WD557_01350 [Dehalococcoidia bacterium]